MARPTFALLALSLTGCTGNTGDSDIDTDTDVEVPADRGPTTIAIDGDPNGLWWQAGTLYIADDDNNRILTWTDADGLALLGDLPTAPENGPGLGQIVVTSDGTIVVTRFGYGTAGDVVTLSADGSTSAIVPNLDAERRRIGLTVAPDGTLYDSWFVSGDAGRAGAVSELALSGSESEAVPDLVKPVGVLVANDKIYVSDQDQGSILVAPLADPSDTSVLSTLDSPDLLCAGPDGSVLTGGGEGDIRQIGADGALTTFGSGYQQIRGVAFDAENTRLFAVDHDADESDGVTNYIQILPVD